MASDWNILSFLPAILFAAETGWLFFRRRPTGGVTEAPPRLQIWIQDMLVLSLMFAASLAWRFNRANWQTVSTSLLSVVLGFAAAVDVASSVKTLSAGRRVAVFLLIMAAFIGCSWISAMLWFIWKRVSAWRGSRRCVDGAARTFAAVVTLIYSVAFFLPMAPAASFPQSLLRRGFDAYFWTFSSFFNEINSADVPFGRLAWMANPCLWIAMAFLLEGRRWMADILAILAVGLAFTANNIDEVTSTTGTSVSITPAINSLTTSPAYAVWFISMVAAAILSLAAAIRRDEKTA